MLRPNIKKGGYIMSKISYYKREALPLEMHKVCIVQKTSILPVEERVKAIRRAGFNSYRMQADDCYLDMLTVKIAGSNGVSNGNRIVLKINSVPF